MKVQLQGHDVIDNGTEGTAKLVLGGIEVTLSEPQTTRITVRKDQVVRASSAVEAGGGGNGNSGGPSSEFDFEALNEMMKEKQRRNRKPSSTTEEPAAVEFEVVDDDEAAAAATAADSSGGGGAALPSFQASSAYLRGMVSNISISNPFSAVPDTVQIGLLSCSLAIRCADGGTLDLTAEDTNALQHQIHGSKKLSRQLQEAVKLRSSDQSEDPLVLNADAVDSKEILIMVVDFIQLATAFKCTGSLADMAAEDEHHASFFREDRRRGLFPLVLAGIDLECHTLAVAAKKEVTRLIQGQRVVTIQQNFSFYFRSDDVEVKKEVEKRALEQKRLIASVRQQTTQDPTDAQYARKMTDRFTSEGGGAAAADPTDIQSCSWCSSAFTVMKRKHRCRLCQLSYCDDCSSRRVKLDPEQIRQFEVANERGIITRLATGMRELAENGRNYDPSEVRACFPCYYVYASGATFVTRIFKECNFGMKDLHLLEGLKMNSQDRGPTSRTDDFRSEVPQLAKDRSSWSISAESCLKDISKLQGKLPAHTFTAMESDLLFVHAQQLCTHSRFLAQLIRSFSQVDDGRDSTQSDLICDLLYSTIQESESKQDRELSCEEAKCKDKGNCQRTLRPQDGLELLAGATQIRHAGLRSLAVDSVMRARPVELFCWLPLLVKALRDEPNMPQSKLFHFLMKCACDSDPELRHALFWELSRHSYDPTVGKRYARCRDRLIVQLAERKLSAHDLIVGTELADVLNSIDYKSAAVTDIQQMVQASVNVLQKDCGRVALPIKPRFQVRRVLDVRRLASSQAPIVLVFSGVDEDVSFDDAGGTELESESTLTVAYKREDLAKDAIVMRVLRLMRQLFNDKNVDVDLVMYNVLPTGVDEGLIEFVKDSTILKDIYKTGVAAKKGEAIRNFILANNPGNEIVAQLRFARSLAAYTVIMFVLGAGDRHDDNVMLRKDGCFFHIDYGYVLGKDPKKFLLNQIGDSMPFSKKYIDAMNGKGSEFYKEFDRHAIEVYGVLRANARVIMNMMLLLVDEDDDIERIEADFVKRFSLGCTEFEASKYLRMFFDNGQWKQDAVNKLHDAPIIIQSAADTAYSATASMFSGMTGIATRVTTRLIQGNSAMFASVGVKDEGV